MKLPLLSAVLALLLAQVIPSVQGLPNHWIWWEAEHPEATNFPEAKPESDRGVRVLSGGGWMMAEPGMKSTPFLEYKVDVPAKARYDFYVRKFWKHGPFRWRFNGDPWQEVTPSVTLLDCEEFRPYTCVNWVLAGSVNLPAGKNRLRIELTDPKSPGAFDCFLLTDGVFAPRGKIKPNEQWPSPAPGWFTFNNDTPLEPSPIDLRCLNEKFAGEHGFISVKDGNFMQDGKPIRFVGACCEPDVSAMDDAQLARLAKFLARKGINLVRFHGPLCVTSGPDAGAVDPRRIDNLQRLVAALKAEGIYTHISVYFQHWFDPSENRAFPGYQKGRPPFAIHFYNPAWEAMYREWWRALLERVNPRTGTALKDDPAVMGLEILNEDSLFFWTFDYKNIPLAQIEPLEKRFGEWLLEKYGSLEKAFEAWDCRHPRDSISERRAGFVPLFDMFRRRNRRDRDTARFLSEVQRSFFDNQYRFLRKEIGVRAPICGSNWRTACTPVLGALDKWTQAGADFYDHHGYVGTWEKRTTGAFLMTSGDMYADRSLSRWDPEDPEKKPLLDVPFLPMRIDGKPRMVSEYAYTGFNAYRTEAPLVTGALFGQSGVNAPVFFEVESTPGWILKLNSTYPLQTPADLAQFPAMALTLRRGMIREADVVASASINVEEMKDLKGNPFTDPSSGDPNRSNEAKGPGSTGLIDLRYFAAGKVDASFTEEPAEFHGADLKTFEPDDNVLFGANREIEWRHRQGLFLLKTPQSQGASGFLKSSGPVDLPDLTIEWGLDFGVAWAVSMDGNPLSTSKKILIQVMSEEKNHGFSVEGAPKHTIKDAGTAPVEVRSFSGTISFKRRDAATLEVTALDPNGVPIRRAGTAERITLLPSVIYYLVEKT